MPVETGVDGTNVVSLLDFHVVSGHSGVHFCPSPPETAPSGGLRTDE